MDSYESAPKTPQPTGLRSRSHSSPSTPSLSSTTTPLATTPAPSSSATPLVTPSNRPSLVFSSKDNAKKVLNIDTPGVKKRQSITPIGALPSNIPLPPSQSSSKKDPSKRNSTSILGRPLTPQPIPTARPLTPQPTATNNSATISAISNLTTTTTTTTTTTSIIPPKNQLTQSQQQQEPNISELLQNNNLDIINQNSAFNSIQKNSSASLSSSSNSTPSPTLLPNISLFPPDLSLDGVNHNSHNNNNNNSHIQNINLSPNSQSNNILNRSSSPSPNGRRTPTPNFISNSLSFATVVTGFSKQTPLNSEREESIQVYCRFRPEIQSEKNLTSSGEKQLTIGEDNRTVHITSQQNSTAHKFSKVFQPTTSQESFYNEVARPLVDDILNGFNVGIIAYGQTGAGKTFTQFGQGISEELPFTAQSYSNGKEENYGITPRIINDLIYKVGQLASERIKFTIRISYLELYREKLYDLFNERSELDIRLADSGFNVPDATQPPIQKFQDFLHYIQIGEKNRAYGDNKKNPVSSRSHVLFIATILKEDLENKDNFLSSLYIVDLAGSESVSQTGATGPRLDETKSINKSLYALGGVIEDMAKKSKHVRYRDSKLTQLLQNCFGGNSKTHLIVNCSSSTHESILRDTIQSLNFAERTQSVKNKTSVNVELSNHQLKQQIHTLKNENSNLRKFIESNTSNMGTIPPSQMSAYINDCQNNIERYKSQVESLVSTIQNLEEDQFGLEELKRRLEEQMVLKEKEYQEKFQESCKISEQIRDLHEANKKYSQSLEEERIDLENRIRELEIINEDIQSKYESIKAQEQINCEELERSLKEREELLGHLTKIKEKNKEMEKERAVADELRIKLTKSSDQLVNKIQEIEQLNNQKLKWKNKSHEYLKQKNQLEEQLKLLQTTNDMNENEQIKNQQLLLIELQSKLSLALEREESIKKELESIKNKNNEQTIILQNFNNQINQLTNKIEIEFPTIVNRNNQKRINQSSSTSTSSSIETNLTISMSNIEYLFENIIKNQQSINNSNSNGNSNSDGSGGASIMDRLVEIDENEQFIKKEKEKDSVILNNSKVIQDIHSNILQKQEEIKQLIKDQFNSNNNSNNSNASSSGSSSSSSSDNIKKNQKLKAIKKSHNDSHICMNILLGIFGIIVLFFLMVGVGLFIQRLDAVNGSNYYKAT